MNEIDQSDRPLPQPPVARWGIIVAGILAMLIGAFWLGAWFTGYAAERSAAGLITLKTNTALGMFLGGLALLLLGTGRPNGARTWVGTLIAAIVLLIGALTLSEHLFGWNLGIDHLLAKEQPGAAIATSPNRMGPPASLSLTLLGIGLLAISLRKRAIAPYLGIAVCIINLIPAVGYLYDIGGFYTAPHLTAIAWPTVIALISLGIGLILSRTDRGPVSLLFRDDAGGRLFRKMLPWVILIPLVLPYLRIIGQSGGLYDDDTGRGWLVISLILSFMAVLWRSARDLSRSDTAHRQDEEALRESRAKLQAAFASMTEAIFIADTEGRLVEFNEGFVRYHRFKDREECSRTIADCPKYLEAYFQDGTPAPPEMWAMARALRGEAASDVEYMLRRKESGETWWGSYNFAPIKDEDGRIVGAVVACREITERKKAEEELERERKQLLAVIESLDEAVGVWNTDGSLVLINDATAKLYGFEMKEEMLRHLSDYADVQVRTMDGCELPQEEWPPSRVLRGETFSDWELEQYIPSINKRFIGSNSGRPVRDANGEIILGVTSVRDITERKQAEEEIEKAQRQVQSIIDNTPSLVYALDLEERFLIVNRALAELVNSTPEQMIGRRRHEFMPQDDADWHEANDRQAIAAGKALEFEEYSELPGRSITWLTTKFPLRDAQGKIYAVGGITADVSERKKAEVALRESRKTFVDLVEGAPFGMYIIDSQFRVAHMNINSQNGAFRNVRPVIGRDFSEAMHTLWPDDVAEGIIAKFRHTLETGEPFYSPRFTHSRHDVEIVESYEWELHRVTLPSGEDGVVCYYFDSTELRNAEDALEKAHKELEERAAELQDVNEGLAVVNEELESTTEELLKEVEDRTRAQNALRQEQEHKLDFYRRTIDAATGGKLVIMESEEIERLAGPAIQTWDIGGPDDLKPARHGVEEMARAAGIDERRVGELTVAVGEAVMNVVKHAGQGEASFHRTDDSLIVLMRDRGPGIAALALPDVALRPGYSTAGTLGMGYKMMITFADKVRLATGDEGTMVALEMKIHPAESSPARQFMANIAIGGGQ